MSSLARAVHVCRTHDNPFIAYRNLLQGASEAIEEDEVEYPPELCQGLLKIATTAEDDHLRENQIAFRNLVAKVTLEMKNRATVSSGPYSTEEEAKEMMKSGEG